MRGAGSILVGFLIGMMLGAGGYYASISGGASSAGLALDQLQIEPVTIKAQTNYPAARNETDRLSAMGVVIIGNERGGYISEYARRTLKWREDGTLLRFTGRCDSACTLYLALPYEQTCISEGASFRFHAPIAGSQKARHLAQVYMLNAYPEWVRSWIDAVGGLSEDLVTMNFEYASRYMRPCDSEKPKEILRTASSKTGVI
jgi:hypothetical protein